MEATTEAPEAREPGARSLGQAHLRADPARRSDCDFRATDGRWLRRLRATLACQADPPGELSVEPDRIRQLTRAGAADGRDRDEPSTQRGLKPLAGWKRKREPWRVPRLRLGLVRAGCLKARIVRAAGHLATARREPAGRVAPGRVTPGWLAAR